MKFNLFSLRCDFATVNVQTFRSFLFKPILNRTFFFFSFYKQITAGIFTVPQTRGWRRIYFNTAEWARRLWTNEANVWSLPLFAHLLEQWWWETVFTSDIMLGKNEVAGFLSLSEDVLSCCRIIFTVLVNMRCHIREQHTLLLSNTDLIKGRTELQPRAQAEAG